MVLENGADGEQGGLPLPPPAATEAWASSNIADQKQKKSEEKPKTVDVGDDGRDVESRSRGLDVKENLVMWEEEMRSAVKSIAREDDAAALWAARVRVLASKKNVK